MKITLIVLTFGSWVGFPVAFVLSEGSVVTIMIGIFGLIGTLVLMLWNGQSKRIADTNTNVQKLEYDTNERFKEVTDKNSENLDRIFTKVEEIQKEQSNTQIMIAEKMATKTDIKDLHERINNKEDKKTGA